MAALLRWMLLVAGLWCGLQPAGGTFAALPDEGPVYDGNQLQAYVRAGAFNGTAPVPCGNSWTFGCTSPQHAIEYSKLYWAALFPNVTSRPRLTLKLVLEDGNHYINDTLYVRNYDLSINCGADVSYSAVQYEASPVYFVPRCMILSAPGWPLNSTYYMAKHQPARYMIEVNNASLSFGGVLVHAVRFPGFVVARGASASVLFRKCTFNGITLGDYSSLLAIWYGARLTMDQFSLVGWGSRPLGAILVISGFLELTTGELYGLQGEFGSALTLMNATATVRNVYMETGAAVWGGFLYASYGTTLLVEDCQIFGGAASERGGGAFLHRAVGIFRRTRFVRCIGLHGGGAITASQSEVYLEDVDIRESRVLYGYGTGLDLLASRLVWDRGSLEDNECFWTGAGVGVTNCIYTVHVSPNTSPLYEVILRTFSVPDSICAADLYCMFFKNSLIDLTNNMFSMGDGWAIPPTSRFQIKSVTARRNLAQTASLIGSQQREQSSQPIDLMEMDNCTIYYHTCVLSSDACTTVFFSWFVSKVRIVRSTFLIARPDEWETFLPPDGFALFKSENISLVGTQRAVGLYPWSVVTALEMEDVLIDGRGSYCDEFLRAMPSTSSAGFIANLKGVTITGLRLPQIPIFWFMSGIILMDVRDMWVEDCAVYPHSSFNTMFIVFNGVTTLEDLTFVSGAKRPPAVAAVPPSRIRNFTMYNIASNLGAVITRFHQHLVVEGMSCINTDIRMPSFTPKAPRSEITPGQIAPYDLRALAFARGGGCLEARYMESLSVSNMTIRNVIGSQAAALMADEIKTAVIQDIDAANTLPPVGSTFTYPTNAALVKDILPSGFRDYGGLLSLGLIHTTIVRNVYAKGIIGNTGGLLCMGTTATSGFTLRLVNPVIIVENVVARDVGAFFGSLMSFTMPSSKRMPRAVMIRNVTAYNTRVAADEFFFHLTSAIICARCGDVVMEDISFNGGNVSSGAYFDRFTSLTVKNMLVRGLHPGAGAIALRASAGSNVNLQGIKIADQVSEMRPQIEVVALSQTDSYGSGGGSTATTGLPSLSSSTGSAAISSLSSLVDASIQTVSLNVSSLSMKNVTSMGGSALYVEGCGAVALRDVTLQDVSVPFSLSGLVTVRRAMLPTSALVENLRVVNSRLGQVGAVELAAGVEATLRNVSVSGVSVAKGSGGCVTIGAGARVTVQGLTCRSVTASVDGGAVYLAEDASLLASDVDISAAEAGQGNGGCIAAASRAKLTVLNSRLTTCRTVGGNGGCVGTLGVNTEVSLGNVSLTNCQAPAGAGGGVAGIGAALLRLEGCTVANTSAVSGGSAVFASGGGVPATVVLADSVVADATNAGPFGAVAVVGDPGTRVAVRRSVVMGSSIGAGQTADLSGGGLAVIGPGSTTTNATTGAINALVVEVTQSLFLQNAATTGGGIAVTGGGVAVTITDSLFAGNAAGSLGGGLYADGGRGAVTQCNLTTATGASGCSAVVLDGTTCFLGSTAGLEGGTLALAGRTAAVLGDAVGADAGGAAPGLTLSGLGSLATLRAGTLLQFPSSAAGVPDPGAAGGGSWEALAGGIATSTDVAAATRLQLALTAASTGVGASPGASSASSGSTTPCSPAGALTAAAAALRFRKPGDPWVPRVLAALAAAAGGDGSSSTAPGRSLASVAGLPASSTTPDGRLRPLASQAVHRSGSCPRGWLLTSSSGTGAAASGDGGGSVETTVSECTACPPGYYSILPDSRLCLACPVGAVCAGADAVLPRSGYQLLELEKIGGASGVADATTLQLAVTAFPYRIASGATVLTPVPCPEPTACEGVTVVPCPPAAAADPSSGGLWWLQGATAFVKYTGEDCLTTDASTLAPLLAATRSSASGAGAAGAASSPSGGLDWTNVASTRADLHPLALAHTLRTASLSCSQGYDPVSFLCSECAPGYGKSLGAVCVPCPSAGALAGLELLVLSLVGVLVVIYVRGRSILTRSWKAGSANPTAVSRVRLFVSYLQVLSLLTLLQLKWSSVSGVGGFQDVLLRASFTSGLMASADCFATPPADWQESGSSGSSSGGLTLQSKTVIAYVVLPPVCIALVGLIIAACNKAVRVAKASVAARKAAAVAAAAAAAVAASASAAAAAAAGAVSANPNRRSLRRPPPLTADATDATIAAGALPLDSSRALHAPDPEAASSRALPATDAAGGSGSSGGSMPPDASALGGLVGVGGEGGGLAATISPLQLLPTLAAAAVRGALALGAGARVSFSSAQASSDASTTNRPRSLVRATSTRLAALYDSDRNVAADAAAETATASPATQSPLPPIRRLLKRRGSGGGSNSAIASLRRTLARQLTPHRIAVLSASERVVTAVGSARAPSFETALHGVLCVFLLLHLPVATRLLSVFNCDAFGGVPRLLSDLNTVCWQGQHLTVQVPLAVVFLLLWTVAPLAAIFILLRRDARSLHIDPLTVRRFGVLYLPYRKASRWRPWVWWDALALMGWKQVGCAAALVATASSGPFVQCFTAIGVLGVYLVATVLFRPFALRGLNNLEMRVTAVEGATFFLLATMIAFQQSAQVISSWDAQDALEPSGSRSTAAVTLQSDSTTAAAAAVFILLLNAATLAWLVALLLPKCCRTQARAKLLHPAAAALTSAKGRRRADTAAVDFANPLKVARSLDSGVLAGDSKQAGGDSDSEPPLPVELFAPEEEAEPCSDDEGGGSSGAASGETKAAAAGVSSSSMLSGPGGRVLVVPKARLLVPKGASRSPGTVAAFNAFDSSSSGGDPDEASFGYGGPLVFARAAVASGDDDAVAPAAAAGSSSSHGAGSRPVVLSSRFSPQPTAVARHHTGRSTRTAGGATKPSSSSSNSGQ